MKMNKKTSYRLFLVFVILMLANMAFAEASNASSLNQLGTTNNTDRPSAIGGDKDEHGCYITAGYSWCDEKQKCLRAWEEECTAQPSCVCPDGYIQDGNACNPKCYYSTPKCLMPSIICKSPGRDTMNVEISSLQGSANISIEPVGEDSSSFNEGLTSVRSSRRLVIAGNRLMMNTSSGDKEIKVMPSTASSAAVNQLKLKNYDIELKDAGKPVYEITGKKKVKILGLISAEMSIKSQIDAETGAETTQKPWWSFFAKE